MMATLHVLLVYSFLPGFEHLLWCSGDSQALPGFISVYLQVTGSSGKWECFASYRLSILNQQDTGKSIVRDSW